MISLDWKNRLEKDTEEFFRNKLPLRHYDFEIIFNAYPERVHNKVPKEVVVFVAKALVTLIGKDASQYLDFYDYLWTEKGEQGRIAYVYLIQKLYLKNPSQYQAEIEKRFFSMPDTAETALLLDKTFLAEYKKAGNSMLSIFLHWLHHDQEAVQKAAMKLLIKISKADTSCIPSLIKRLESSWPTASKEYLKLNVLFLKAIATIDKAAYLHVFESYKASRDPQVIEILCAAISFYDGSIDAIIENWTHSGHARVKKAATAGLKVLRRKKEANE